MIECTDENIYYNVRKKANCGKRKCRTQRRSKFKRFVFFLFLAVTVIGLYLHVNGPVYRLITDICADYAESCAISSVNSAVALSLSDKEQYSDFITVERNNAGDISFMSVNSHKINSVSRTVSLSAEALLKSALQDGVPIPIAAFTGFKFAAGYGKPVRYFAVNVVSVNCVFDGQFTSVGINQTLHSLYVIVTCSVDVEFLLKKERVECASEILISESVLVGKVPEVYLNGSLFG